MRSGKQRWFCKRCHKVFVWKNKGASKNQKLKLFRKWVIGKRTLSDLSKEGRKSVSTLRRIFKYYLNKPPRIKPSPNSKSILMIDGTRFENNYCLILYWDITLDKPQGLRISTGEKSQEIIQDLQFLKDNQVNCLGVVSDGGTGIISGLKAVYGDIPKQRCLVHIQRRTLGWLTLKPKTKAGIYLREICKCINGIRTRSERDEWIKIFWLWDKKYNKFLKERTLAPDGKHWWYTHRNLRRVRRHLLNALPFMFLYLNHPNLPKDTNKLEGGVFSWLKSNCGLHRGISKDKRNNFLTWYIHFKYFDK